MWSSVKPGKGFGKLGQVVDVVVRSRLRSLCKTCNKLFDATLDGKLSLAAQMEHGSHEQTVDIGPIPTVAIEECGFTLDAQGIEIQNPTFDLLITMINAIRMKD